MMRTICMALMIAAMQSPNSRVPVPQSPEPRIPSPVTFDSARAWAHLTKQVEFGPRPAGSPALDECRRYIVSQLEAIGLHPREQAFEARTPNGPVRMANVVATIPGRRPERIALATHFDTKLFTEFRFVGASDGASSTATVLELARVLTARQNEFTIELLFFDGEEAVIEWGGTDRTYGSRHYVQAARQDGSLRSLKALVLLDMIGDHALTVSRDTNSTPWLNDIIWASAAKLGHTATFLDQDLAIEDDHLPFLEAGIPAVDIIDFDYPVWHTAKDDLPQVSARSLQIVAEVVLDALPAIEQRLSVPVRRIGF